MEFNQNNSIVRLCLQGIGMEKMGKPEEASKVFLQAWNESVYDFEKFISVYFIARHQSTASDKLKWLETAVQIALKMNDASVKSAFPSLYSSIARCYEEMGDVENAKKNDQLAASFSDEPSDKGPFYHERKRIYRLVIC